MDQELEAFEPLLDSTRTIAVVGLSADPWAESHGVAAYLQSQGYRIIPVSPKYAGQTILGEPVRASLREIEEPVDIVDVFRRPSGVPQIAEDAIAMRSHPRAFWMQLGIRNEAAAKQLEEAGIQVVQDRCLGVTHRSVRMMRAARKG